MPSYYIIQLLDLFKCLIINFEEKNNTDIILYLSSILINTDPKYLSFTIFQKFSSDLLEKFQLLNLQLLQKLSSLPYRF